MADKEKDYNFYKEFYDQNRVKLLQYDNLRLHFNKMVKDILSDNYYNMAYDVYECDRICCEDITHRANKGLFKKLFNKN